MSWDGNVNSKKKGHSTTTTTIIPYIEYPVDFSSSSSSSREQLLKRVFSCWMSSSRGPKCDPKILIENMDRIKFCFFETGSNSPSPTGSFLLYQKYRIIEERERERERERGGEKKKGKRNVIYCIGCIEKSLRSKKQRLDELFLGYADSDGDSERESEWEHPFHSHSRINGTNYLGSDTYIVYLLGFISSQHPSILLGNIVSKGSMKMYNHILKDDTILIPMDYLSLDIASLLSSESNHKTEKEKGKETKEEKIKEKGKDEIISLFKSEPTLYIYIFGWDPPTESDMILFFTSNNENTLQSMLFDRLRLLHDISKKSLDSSSSSSLSSSSSFYGLSMDKQNHLLWDRICMHFLITCVGTKGTKKLSSLLCLEDWYISAEVTLLSLRLEKLLDFEDRCLTLQNNRLERNSLGITLQNDFDTVLCRLQEQRMRVAVKYFSEYNTSSSDDIGSKLAQECVSFIEMLLSSEETYE